MTTATKSKTPAKRTAKTGKAASRKKAASKPLRIREELLPDSVRYISIDGIEYVALPVADFGDWYEELSDSIAADCADEEPGPSIPLDEVFAETERRGRIK